MKFKIRQRVVDGRKIRLAIDPKLHRSLQRVRSLGYKAKLIILVTIMWPERLSLRTLLEWAHKAGTDYVKACIIFRRRSRHVGE